MTDYASLLLEERERLLRLVFELAGAFDEIVDASKFANLDDEHDPEGATVAFERAQISVLLERARGQLTEVDAARKRLHQGSYGVCEGCRRDIPAERLVAQPATRVCVGCAGALRA